MMTETIEKQSLNLESFFARVLSKVDYEREAPDILRERQSLSLTEKLNAMIGSGASFDISTDDFQICGVEGLTDAEKHFLYENKPQILCTLQQAALQKYLSLDDLQMFVDEVRERAAIVSDGETLEPLFEIVSTITGEWFKDLLDFMSNPARNL